MTPSIALKTQKLLREPIVFEDCKPCVEVNLTPSEIEVLENYPKD